MSEKVIEINDKLGNKRVYNCKRGLILLRHHCFYYITLTDLNNDYRFKSLIANI